MFEGISAYDGFYYYFKDAVLNRMEIATETLTPFITISLDSFNINSTGTIFIVAKNQVFYTTLDEDSEPGNVHLFTVAITGGLSQYLVSWFSP